MAYTIVYFSPTGNAFHLAKKLAGHLDVPDSQILPLEFTDPQELVPSQHLILLYPVHGFNAPTIVKQFVNNLPEQLYDKVSLLGVGCNTIWVNDAVSLELRRTLEKKNYLIIVDEVVAMPLTFIMSFPDKVAFTLVAEAEAKTQELANAIATGQKTLNQVAFKSKLITFMGKAERPAARFFGLELHANKNCVSCGVCWNNCPSKNIRENSKGKPRFGFSCMMCMRCIYSCPEKAISPRVSKFIPIKKGYSVKQFIK